MNKDRKGKKEMNWDRKKMKKDTNKDRKEKERKKWIRIEKKRKERNE